MRVLEKSVVSSNSMQRVKVYRLSMDGKWDDHGTGHVSVDSLERSEELGLFVFDEDDSETLLQHRICPDDIYRKQEDTIISWKDPEFSTELALSFQETAGCSYIWENICNAQRNLHFNSLNNDAFHSANSELQELPAVELSTLPLILKDPLMRKTISRGRRLSGDSTCWRQSSPTAFPNISTTALDLHYRLDHPTLSSLKRLCREI